jgi:hypothetical protein
VDTVRCVSINPKQHEELLTSSDDMCMAMWDQRMFVTGVTSGRLWHLNTCFPVISALFSNKSGRILASLGVDMITIYELQGSNKPPFKSWNLHRPRVPGCRSLGAFAKVIHMNFYININWCYENRENLLQGLVGEGILRITYS